jgi:hypothetical protein
MSLYKSIARDEVGIAELISIIRRQRRMNDRLNHHSSLTVIVDSASQPKAEMAHIERYYESGHLGDAVIDAGIMVR